MLGWDLRLQYRYGFFTVYAVLTAVFVLGLRMIGPALRTDAAVLLIVTDPTVLGFYFIAAVVLVEKQEGGLAALVTSPLADRGYIVSKVVSLSLLAVITSTVVAVLGHGSPTAVSLLIVGVSLSASLFVLIGLVAVARFDSINEYFLSAVGWGSLIFLPLFGYLGIVRTPVFYLLPAQPVLLVVEAAFRPLPAWKVGYALGYLVLGNALAYLWARRAFRRDIVRGGTPSQKLGRAAVPGGTPGTATASPLVGLVRTDLRNWIRDPMLVVAAAGPLLLAVVIRFGAPVMADLAMPLVSLPQYYPVIASSLAVFGPGIYGFVIGMFLLEDREEGVLVAFRTSPLTGGGYLRYRIVTAYVMSVVATLPALIVVDLVSIPPWVLLGAALVAGLGGPVIAMAFGSLAANTIEGIAISKFLNLLILGPAVVIAIVPTPHQYLAGVLPAYWPLKALVAGIEGDPAWPVYLVGGLVVHGLAMWAFTRRFVRRAD